MNVNFLSICTLLLFIGALIYRIIAWTKKDDNCEKHYSLLSEIYIVGFFVLMGLGHQSKCSNPSQIVTIHDTIFTHAPTGDEVIPGINPHWNNIPETTYKTK